MKFTRLTIQNFMAIGEADVDLADKGLVLIQGENLQDSSAVANGAGKSTLADALYWCLYGATREGLSADAVVNRKAGKDCCVTVHVTESDGTTHVIQRWRKKNIGGKRSGVSLKSTPPGGSQVDLTKGSDKLTQVEIDRVLGCSEEVFQAAVYARQNSMPDLPAATDSQLKQLIEEASGVTVLVKAYEIARQRLRDAEIAHDSWRQEHVRLEREVQGIQSRIADLEARTQGYEVKRKTEIAAATTDFNAAKARARQKQLERDNIDPVRVQKDIDALDAKIDAVAGEQTRESQLHAELAEATAQLTTAKTILNAQVNEAKAKRTEYDQINDRIGKPCTTCGKPYEEHDLGRAKEIAEEALRIAVGKARDLQADLTEYEATVEARRNALEAFRSSKTDVSATVTERKRLAVLLTARTSAEEAFAREVTDAQRLAKLIEDKKAEVNPYGPLLTAAEAELADAIDAYRTSEVHGVELEKAVMVAKDVVKVYGPAGVRAHVLDTVTPFLNDRTATYLGIMSDGNISAVWSTLTVNAKGELKEQFSITVSKTDDADSYAGLSGGEQRKVKLATAFALQDLVGSRATKPIELWVGDEIDHAMDTAGLERLMNVLESKARERGTVLVISHNALNDWIRESQVVTRKDGVSTTTGILDVPVALAA